MRKLKLLIATLTLVVGGMNSLYGQASYNQTYKNGATVAEGGNYFLYNIESGMFLTDGMDYGTHASIDHAGRVITLSSSGSGYTINTTPFSANGTDLKAGGLFLNDKGEPFVDGTSAEWTFENVNVDGYTNVYAIKTGDKYLYIDYADNLYQNRMGAFVRAGNITGNTKSYWLLIPISDRQAAKDYTYLLRNTDFNHPWEYPVWTNDADWTNIAGGKKENACAEMYGKGFDINQTVSATIENGRYRLYNQAFYNNNDANNQTYLYANSDQAAIRILNANGEGTAADMAGASDAFTAGQYVNSVETFVSNGSLKVGIKNATTAGQAWTIMDNFYLEYLGQCVMDYAVALPEGGAMEADTWYYFDVALAANNYTATATTLSDIVCTANGYTLTSTTTGDVALSAENNSLSATRYYVKSSSANNLVISVASYTYTISEATVGASYVQPGNTVTVTFATNTNDPTGTLTQDYSGVTFNNVNANATALENGSGFSFVVPDVATAETFTLAIPAGAIKFNDDNQNAAQDITLKTPAVLDGNYYLYNPYTNKFLSRGHSHGTAAVADIYGVPFALITDGEGKSTVKFVDNEKYLFNTYWLFADGANPDKFVISAQTIGEYSGYAFFNQNLETNNRMYVYVNEGNGDNYRVAGNAIVGDNCANEAQTVWQIKTVEEHNAIVNAYPTQNIQNVITASGISTTTANFSTYMSANYVETDKTSLIGTSTFGTDAGDWTWTQVRGEDGWPKYTDGYARLYQATGSYTQTISADKLPAGIYKISMAGFDRRGANDVDIALATTYGSVSSSYLMANDQQVRMKSWKEMFDNASQEDTWNGQKNSMDGGFADNELYIYLDGSTDLTLTIAKPNYCSVSYMCFGNFKLTRYETLDNAKEELAAAINAAEANLGFEIGEYAPYNNVDALQTLAAAKAINVDEASGAVIVAATTALTEATWTANTEEVNAIAGGEHLDSYTHQGNYDLANGWSTGGDPYGYKTRIQGISEGTNNIGLEGLNDRRALLVKFGTSYGEAAGYTLPLKANTTYKFSFTYGLWNEDVLIEKRLKVVSPSGETIAMTPDVVSKNEGDKNTCGHVNKDAWYSYEAYFTTSEAGNYVLNIENVDGNNQRQMAFADLVLKKAVAEDVTIAESADYTPVAKYANVTFNRTLVEGWNGLVLPFDMTVDEAKDAFNATAVKDLGSVTSGENGAVLNFVDAAEIKAGRPFMLKAAAGTSYTINNVLLTDDALQTVQKASDGNAAVYTFTGTYAGTTDLTNVTFFLINGTKYYYHTAGVNSSSAKAFRAYFVNETPTAHNSRVSFNFGDDTTTGIEALSTKALGGEVYNLNGQKVEKAQKGLYIVNGKKVVIK